jgi:hypothetical protein
MGVILIPFGGDSPEMIAVMLDGNEFACITGTRDAEPEP